MKYKWITTIISSALLANGMALAGDNDKPFDRPPGKERPDRELMRKKMLEKFDKDGDGKLNEAERAEAREAGKKRAAEFFAKIDKNGDGKISKDEAPEEMWVRISKADKDGDGAVSKEELAAARAARDGKGGRGKARGPKDGEAKRKGPKDGEAKRKGPKDGEGKRKGPKDGEAKREGPKDGEGKRKGPRDGGGNPLEQFDRNADGKLSQDEVPAEIWARMSKADKDGDGLVSGEELKQARKNRAGGGSDKPGKPRKAKDSDS